MARFPTATNVGRERPRGANRLKGVVKVVIVDDMSLILRPSLAIVTSKDGIDFPVLHTLSVLLGQYERSCMDVRSGNVIVIVRRVSSTRSLEIERHVYAQPGGGDKSTPVRIDGFELLLC